MEVGAKMRKKARLWGKRHLRPPKSSNTTSATEGSKPSSKAIGEESGAESRDRSVGVESEAEGIDSSTDGGRGAEGEYSNKKASPYL